MWVVSLDHVDAVDVVEVGGKAAALARLRRLGVRTPDGAVVRASALRALLGGHAASAAWAAARVDRERGEEVARWITEAPLPAGLLDDLAVAVRELGAGALAVRSSGVDEDGASRSRAGTLATLLGIEPARVDAAVRAVWASRFRGAGLALGGASWDVAVLVQPMIEATAAGVAFTIHPVSGSWRELRIEAVPGLAAPLVDGRVAPQAWSVRRGPRLGGRGPLGLPSGVVITRADTPDVGSASRVVDGRVVDVPAPPGPALSPDEVLAVARDALEVERAAGRPQDVEWALDARGARWVLQARPITAAGVPLRPRRPLWTRRFLGERWTVPATPMGWSIVEPALSWHVAYPATSARLLSGEPVVRCVDGEPWLEASLFRHLAFKLPGAALPAFLAELLPEHELAAWRARFAVAPDLAVYASILGETARERRWERFAWGPASNPSTWRTFAREVGAQLDAAPRAWPDPGAAVAEVERWRLRLRDYVGIHVISLLYAHLARQLLDAHLHAFAPTRAAAWMEALDVPPRGNPTLAALEELAGVARGCADVDVDALAAGGLGAAPASLRGPLEVFLQRHGHRSACGWELFAPTWAEAPEALAPSIRTLRQRPARVAPRPDVVEELADVLPAAAVPAALALVWASRRYLALREAQRAVMERIMGAIRRPALAVGEELRRRGALGSADDVRWISWDEARAALAGAPARPRRPMPPVALREAADVGPWRGLALSPGRAEGVVSSAPGGVRVLRALDSGDAPTLIGAAAVVVELGGVLSHGAVLARELGVPMVGDVAGAVGALPLGARVGVDGSQGRVWVVGGRSGL